MTTVRQETSSATQDAQAETRRNAAGCSGSGVSSETLLGRYRRKPSVKLRNQLIERHRGFVEGVAHNLALRLPRSVDVQDLVHAGIWGLMRAIENFRTERGDQFIPYLRPRVRGAMLDELRHMDYLPRLYRKRLRDREEAVCQLTSRLQREPCDGEIAAELGITEELLRRSYSDTGSVQSVGQEQQSAGSDRPGAPESMDSLPDEDLESPIEMLHRQELLAKIEASLQPIEWTVLKMHYFEGMSGQEVAQSLRLSASRICQIHVRVLSRLKARLASAAGI